MKTNLKTIPQSFLNRNGYTAKDLRSMRRWIKDFEVELREIIKNYPDNTDYCIGIRLIPKEILGE